MKTRWLQGSDVPTGAAVATRHPSVVVLLLASFTHGHDGGSPPIEFLPKDCAVRATDGLRVAATANAIALACVDAQFFERFFRNVATWHSEGISRIPTGCQNSPVSVVLFLWRVEISDVFFDDIHRITLLNEVVFPLLVRPPFSVFFWRGIPLSRGCVVVG